ncbi:MAG: tRNA (N6-threonylcarbamoyladenosine(37)-N6)-methyltransferase TrmO [Calditrichaeota bacterium]|nr:tRNA (N6-threonylcarbamoyladenosine(37)-N6)-methyltransferase TrmO [Calditrichota bacterium]
MPGPYQIKPIGLVHSRFNTREEVINSRADNRVGEIEIFKEYKDGLSDLEGFSHIIVIFWMHKSSFRSLKVQPIYHPEKLRGVFATRHPDRPNPLGLTVVELLEKRECILRVKGIDMLDGTPVIDIKPYTRGDQRKTTRFGWLTHGDNVNNR